MLASDTRVVRVRTKQNAQDIIYQESLRALLQVKQKLRVMAEQGEIDLSTMELNKSLYNNLAELASKFDRQLTAANLWQSSNRCLQCRSKLAPLVEVCACGYKNDLEFSQIGDRLDFIIAENCTE